MKIHIPLKRKYTSSEYIAVTNNLLHKYTYFTFTDIHHCAEVLGRFIQLIHHQL